MLNLKTIIMRYDTKGMIQSDSYDSYKRFKEFLNGGNPTLICVDEFEDMGIGVGGEIIKDEVQYMELFIDFSDDMKRGFDFIQTLSKEKIESVGLHLYESKSPWSIDELDKEVLMSMLKTTGGVKIKLKFTD